MPLPRRWPTRPSPGSRLIDGLRTCIGCRQRAEAEQLLRVVVAPDATAGDLPAVVPDPRRRLAGRGAWVHPDQACVELAERRRAFGRALKVPGPVDPAAVGEFVGSATRRQTVGDTSNERSMKRQQ